VTYQKYCSSECREAATKEKVNAQYQIKRRKKLSLERRRCAGECGTVLSVYNNSKYCSTCFNKKKIEKAMKELKGLFDYEGFK
jgi:NADH:ubiquinone oxidoreductase subunit E